MYGAAGISGYLFEPSIKKDSILVTKDGSGVGSLRYVKGPHSFVGTLNSLTSKEDIYLPYIYYAILNVKFESYRTGQAIPHIYFKDYGRFSLFCPPQKKQKELAYGLELIDNKIEVERRVLRTLQSAKVYLLNNLFI